MQEWMLSQLWQRIWSNMTGSMTGWVAAITANTGSQGSWPFPENLWEPKCSHVGSWQVSTYIFYKAVRVMHGCAVHQPASTTKRVPNLNKNSLFNHFQIVTSKWTHGSLCFLFVHQMNTWCWFQSRLFLRIWCYFLKLLGLLVSEIAYESELQFW